MVGKLISVTRGVFVLCMAMLLLLAVSCKNQLVEDAKNVVAEAHPVLNPVFTPTNRASPDPIDVTIACDTEGAAIIYTVDGTTPSDTNGTTYSGPIHITAMTIFKAIGCKEYMKDSDVVEALYNVGMLPIPRILLPSGLYNDIQNVSLSPPDAVPDAEVRYTTDGTDPLSSSALYSGTAVTIDNTKTHLRARCFKTGWTESDVVACDYTIKAQTPIFSVAAGTWDVDKNLLISTPLTGSSDIRITTSATNVANPTAPDDPGTGDTQYSGAIHITTTRIIKARAYKTGVDSSDVQTATYHMVPTVPSTPTNPADGFTANYDLSTLTWAASKDPSGTVTYDVHLYIWDSNVHELNEQSLNSSTGLNLAQWSISPALQAGITTDTYYWWRIIARNPNGETRERLDTGGSPLYWVF
jgi:hypothetical protein